MVVSWSTWDCSCDWSSIQVEAIPVREGIGLTSAAAGRLDVKSKVSEAVDEADGNTNAGLTVFIVEESAPGTRSTILDIGDESICLKWQSRDGGKQGMEVDAREWSVS
jgi:hypothetical protein